MDSQEWQSSDDPERMLEFLLDGGLVTTKQLRDFVWECRLAHRAEDRERWLPLRETAGIASIAMYWVSRDLGTSRSRIIRILRDIVGDPFFPVASESIYFTNVKTHQHIRDLAYKRGGKFLSREKFCQEIEKHLFCTSILNTEIIRLAQAARQGDWEVLAPLSDALEEAGCDNTRVLGHLRQPLQHCSSCWVLSLILGHPNHEVR